MDLPATRRVNTHYSVVLRRGSKVVVVCLVALLAALAVTAGPARACSCIPPDPWSYLRQADGAFVGELVSRRSAGQGRDVLLFRVERAVKGRIGATVEVETADNGAACGIEGSVGQRIGLFLRREGGGWFGHLCWQVSPEDLLAAAALPAPNGQGHVALLLGGRFGPARTLALDAKGRTLAYGMGRGRTTLLSPCPGARRVAELAQLPSGPELAIRETSAFQVTRRQAVALPGRRLPARLVCENASGSSVVVFGIGAGDSPVGAALFRLARGSPTVIWKGTAYLSSLTRRAAYLNAGELAARLVRVDLRTGRVTRLAWLPRSPRVVPDATGERFAGVAYRLGERSRLFLVDLTTRPATVRSAPLAGPEVLGDVIWVSSRRLLFLPYDRRETARLLDLRLRTLLRFRWTAGDGARVGSTVFGLEGRALVRAALPAGPTRVVRRLPGEPWVIVSG